jgi:hypothetical protein
VLLQNSRMTNLANWGGAGGVTYYRTSSVRTWANGAFVNSIEADVRALIMPVRLPNRQGVAGTNRGTVLFGADSYECSAFLLSGAEVGFEGVGSYGAPFAYFADSIGAGNNPLRAAIGANGITNTWWLRSGSMNDAFTQLNVVQIVLAQGSRGGVAVTTTNVQRLLRPAIVLPNTAAVGADGRLLANGVPPVTEPVTTPPTSPTSPSEPPTSEPSEPPTSPSDSSTSPTSSPDSSEPLTEPPEAVALAPEQWAFIENHIITSRIALVVGLVILTTVALYKFLRIFI